VVSCRRKHTCRRGLKVVMREPTCRQGLKVVCVNLHVDEG